MVHGGDFELTRELYYTKYRMIYLTTSGNKGNFSFLLYILIATEQHLLDTSPSACT